MYQPAEQSASRNKTIKRILTFVILLVFIGTIAFSAAFLLAFTKHEHNHNSPRGGCSVCLQLQCIKQFLKQLNPILGLAVLSGFVYLILIDGNRSYKFSQKKQRTLVALKIRMND